MKHAQTRALRRLRISRNRGDLFALRKNSIGQVRMPCVVFFAPRRIAVFYAERNRPGAKMSWESKADFRRRIRAKSGRGGPQIFTERLSWVGHQGSEANAFSDAQRAKTRGAVSVRRWRFGGASELGSRAK